MTSSDDQCRNCSTCHVRKLSRPSESDVLPSKHALETEAAYQGKRWDHLDARVLCRSGYIRFPWP